MLNVELELKLWTLETETNDATKEYIFWHTKFLPLSQLNGRIQIVKYVLFLLHFGQHENQPKNRQNLKFAMQ